MATDVRYALPVPHTFSPVHRGFLTWWIPLFSASLYDAYYISKLEELSGDWSSHNPCHVLLTLKSTEAASPLTSFVYFFFQSLNVICPIPARLFQINKVPSNFQISFNLHTVLNVFQVLNHFSPEMLPVLFKPQSPASLQRFPISFQPKSPASIQRFLSPSSWQSPLKLIIPCCSTETQYPFPAFYLLPAYRGSLFHKMLTIPIQSTETLCPHTLVPNHYKSLLIHSHLVNYWRLLSNYNS